jgi:threonine dehydratase
MRNEEGSVPFQDILDAGKRISPYILKTGLFYSPALSKLLGGEIYLKPECFQITGSFKVRGACNLVASLTPEERSRGLVTCSSGNHGGALSYAASLFGYPRTTVFVPEEAEEIKQARIRAYGAEIREEGKDFLEAYGLAREYAEQTGGRYAHSHGDPLVIAGQGTIGLEILEALPDVDMVVVPVGGGGLISGIATAVKEVRRDVCFFGVEAAAAPGAFLSFRDGFCHESVDIKPSLADGLLGTLTPLTYSISGRYVAAIKIVEEDQIRRAMETLFRYEQLVVEGSAAVGLAALQEGMIDVSGRKLVLVLTGRNIGSEKFLKAIRKFP